MFEVELFMLERKAKAHKGARREEKPNEDKEI